MKRQRVDLFEVYAFAHLNFLKLFWRLKTLNSDVQTPELDVECDWKEGWIIGITKTPSVVSRWALSHNLRSHIAAQTSAMFDIHCDDRLIHKESAKERQAI